MRTTVRIDDDLYRAVKERAAREGRTVAAVMEDAVRVGMEQTRPAEREPYSVRPLQAGPVRGGIDVRDNSSVRDLIDGDVPLEKMR